MVEESAMSAYRVSSLSAAGFLLVMCMVFQGCQCEPPASFLEESSPAVVAPRLVGEVSLEMGSTPTYGGDDGTLGGHPEVEALLSRLGVDVTYDRCLGRAAEEYARFVKPEDKEGKLVRLPSQLQTAVLHRSGCTDGWVSSHLYFTNTSNSAGFLEYVSKVVKDSGGGAFLGVGRSRAVKPYRWSYVVFLADRQAVFDEMPRAYRGDEMLKVSGILLGDLERPDVLVMAPGGDVEPLQVREREGGVFEASTELPDVPGEHWVEVLATGRMGPQVVALFPVYVDVEPPSVVVLKPVPDESGLGSQEAERLMFRLLNSDRRRYGLPSLKWDDAIAVIARDHSADMRDVGYFAHVSPSGLTLRNRFDAASFAAYSMGENISRNDLVADAQAGLMQSLGHRANILNAKFTHVGVGVVEGRDTYGQKTLFLTQNFAVPQRRLTPLQVRGEVEERLGELRLRQGHSRLEIDSVLQELAKKYVTFGGSEGESAKALTQQVKRDLVSRGYQYQSFYVQTHTVLDPEEVELPEAAKLSMIQFVGIGVGQERRGAATQWKTLILMVEP